MPVYWHLYVWKPLQAAAPPAAPAAWLRCAEALRVIPHRVIPS